VLRKLFRRRSVLLGAALVTGMLLLALLAPLLTSRGPGEIAPEVRLQAPSARHWLGTDDFGRDVYTRVLYGARLSFVVGVSVMAVVLTAGVALGLAAGYWRAVDMVAMRVLDGLMAFPGIVLAIALMGALGPGTFTVVVALSIVYTPRVARVVRSVVLVVREAPYVESAVALGARDSLILWRHVLPNSLSIIVVQGSFIFSYAVLGEAALSFLGVGIPPVVATWGNMLSEGRVYMTQAPWLTLFPGLATMVTVLGLNLVGDGLRDLLDPRLRRL
jgi:peptide/nickel transport system permease protein